MKCEKSAKICLEWANDFKKSGNHNESGFWLCLHKYFSSDKEITLFFDIDETIVMLKTLVEMHGVYRNALLPQMRESADKINEERKFMIKKLEEIKI